MDIGMSISTFYIKLVDNTCWTFQHKDESMVTFSKSKPISDDDLDFSQIHIKIVQNIAKIFTGF